MREDQIPSPSLIVDMAVVERNIQRMAYYARQHKIQLRPHTKTHKTVRLAQLQMAAGASGLSVAKVGEAFVMAQASDDILLAYPAIDRFRCETLAKLALEKTVRVAVDSTEAMHALAKAAREVSATIGILVDVDVGYHRTGVQTPCHAVELAQQIDQTAGVRLDGIMIYPGHIKEPAGQQSAHLQAVSTTLESVIDLWKTNGLHASIVSGGSTPTAFQSHQVPQLTEIRPGTYIFNDKNCLTGGWCDIEDCAARFVCTVISTAVTGKAVIDAGSKTLTSDRSMHDPENGGFGLALEYPEAKIVRLTEEHGELDITKCAKAPKLGERIHLIPNHICPCINLQNSIWLRCPDGSFEEQPVDARGKLI